MSEPSPTAPKRVAVEVELDGVVAVYASRTEEVLVLSETASAVWRLLDGRRDEPAVVARLAEDYGVAAEVVAPDVAAVLAAWRDKGVVR
ncbi:PqqD family protein [Aquipuribacter sp. SD81]|uniref:PqqD family protein n=1 Tax=Aquipuribacter sp. SD81 TaxID=3127703 RepID=UPI0030178DD8